MKAIILLILVLFASLSISEPINAQCPNPVDETYSKLQVFLNNEHYNQSRIDLGLSSVSANEIIIMNDNEHSTACDALSQIHPFNQSRDISEYPGPDKITFYKIRNVYLVVVYNFRFHEVDEDEIWVDMVPTSLVVYNSEFENIYANMIR